MRFEKLESADDIACLVKEIGFLPFFANGIKGFSIEECCPRELWFAPDVDGPWEWKGPIARGKTCVYGKFFGGKAGFVSTEWFPDFANYRRDGYDFDARYDDGLSSARDKVIYDTIEANGSLLSVELKELCNYKKGGNKGFETIITRLQMQTYINISDFEYRKDKNGRPYGWGVARYATPEALFGYDMATSAYKRDPMESKEKIYKHLSELLPDAAEKQILKIMK